MIAKDEIHLRAVVLVAINVVEHLRRAGRQAVASAALKKSIQRATEHAFVGGHPLHTKVVADLQHGFRNTSLRRPHTSRTHAKDLLMQVERAKQLLACVFGMLEALGG